MATEGILELLDVGVILHAADSSIQFANDAACRMLGLSREQMLSRSSHSNWDICDTDGHPVDVGGQPAMLVLATGKSVHGVVLGVMLPNLEDRTWLRIDAVPIHRPDGGLDRVLVSFTDVSDEHRRMTAAELARFESEARHASVLRAMSEGVVVHDGTGAIVFANPAAERILGLSIDQMRGVEGVDPRWALVTPNGERLPPDQVPSERTRASGRPCRDVVLGVHRANGERAWLSVSTDSIAGGPDDGRSVVATFTDITPQHETQLALAGAHARFSAVVSAIPGAIYQTLVGKSGGLSIAFVAGETVALVGLTPEEIMAPTFDLTKIVHPDDARDAFKRLNDGQALSPVQLAEFRLRRGDEWRWARARAAATPTEAGLLFTGVIVDITEERTLAAGLERAQRREAMGDLAAGVAHNFNNMLAAALPNLVELAQHVAPAGRPLLDEALRATERAADLVRQLMRLARGEGGGTLEPVDVHAVVVDVAKLCRRTFDRSVEVVVDAKVLGRAMTLSNANQLHQALVNLCLNARDALVDRPNASLFLSLEVTDGVLPRQPGKMGKRGPVLSITVRDTGAGMDEETLRHIGEPFFTTKAPGRGTGLGLASAMRAVREAGGELTVESTVGVGTTFRIALPVHDQPVVSQEHPGGKPATPVGAILVIEDEPLVRNVIVRALKRVASRVEAADNGAQGLAILDGGEPFDLVLLDLSMPGLPGRTVLQTIAERRPGLPVIIMSGNVGERAGLDRAAAILEKPFTPQKLEDVIAEVLG